MRWHCRSWGRARVVKRGRKTSLPPAGRLQRRQRPSGGENKIFRPAPLFTLKSPVKFASIFIDVLVKWILPGRFIMDRMRLTEPFEGDLHERLRLARLAQKLSTRDVANKLEGRLKISHATIAHYEKEGEGSAVVGSLNTVGGSISVSSRVILGAGPNADRGLLSKPKKSNSALPTKKFSRHNQFGGSMHMFGLKNEGRRKIADRLALPSDPRTPHRQNTLRSA